MYIEERQRKDGIKYRYYEKFYDPRFDKWRYKSVTFFTSDYRVITKIEYY